jgi:hypothetical protein
VLHSLDITTALKVRTARMALATLLPAEDQSMVDSKVLIHQLRDRDSIVLSGLFHCIPVMRMAADKIEQLEAALKWACEWVPNPTECSPVPSNDVVRLIHETVIGSPASGEVAK